MTDDQIEQLTTRWRSVAQPPPSEEELFDLVNSAGDPTGVTAPRWLCHILGLCHRTVHLVLRTPQGHLLFQVRSPAKLDWPGALDLAVTGHVSAGLGYDEAIMDEAAEELGLNISAQTATLASPGLIQVGTPSCRRKIDSQNPPIHVCHVTQLYAATLTATGLASLRFTDGEVAGLMVCNDAEAQRLMAQEPERLAPGIFQSLPRYWEWYAGQRGG